MTFLITILKGIIIGIANAIPGVSGGTMAVILNIYDKLLSAIDLNLKKLKENWKFLLSIGLGCGLGILLAARVLGFLFERYNVPTQFLFMGIIIGSIPMVFKEAVSDKKKLYLKNILPFLCGLAVIIGVEVARNSATDNLVYTTLTPGIFFYLLAVAVIAAITMIVPGVSGSFVMLILGGYQTVITAINSFNIPILLPIAIGVGIGIIGGAKLISILIKRYRQTVYLVILGLVFGSLYSIYPNEFSLSTHGVPAIIAMLIGIALPNLTKLPKASSEK